VLELCREAHFPVEETTLHDGDLLEAEEAFITSSTREIVPAVKVDHTAISDGRPGTITKALMAAFHTKVDQVAAMPENSR
jgi:branched-subunit amino acid aminotransferase/4-amino-4-deoxychorismate lyase